MTTWKTTPNKSIDVDGTSFAYRGWASPATSRSCSTR